MSQKNNTTNAGPATTGQEWYHQYVEGRGYVWQAGKPAGLASDVVRLNRDGIRYDIYCGAGYIGWEATLSEAIAHWNRWQVGDSAFCKAHDC